ncbi:hypothetical protein Avbf_15240 [Armadillidium vulgare]|nr:hypothetical protein Avbf_15240 [Armadillidium vulgare]
MNKESIRRLMMERIQVRTWKNILKKSLGCPSHYIQKTRESFLNVFEHATICNFAEERPFEYSSDYYVVLKDILYGFDSPLKAVENCNKVFDVAHVRYPFECEDVVFHSKNFFEFETEWDKTVSGVCELISDIISYNIYEIFD